MPFMPLFFRKAVLESRLGAALRSGGKSGKGSASGQRDVHSATTDASMLPSGSYGPVLPPAACVAGAAASAPPAATAAAANLRAPHHLRQSEPALK
jgi:hypothetical protein